MSFLSGVCLQDGDSQAGHSMNISQNRNRMRCNKFSYEPCDMHSPPYN